MENYYFEHQAVDASGIVEATCNQVIAADNLEEAIRIFQKQHGKLSPDENGVCIVITCISWQPA